VRGPGPRPDLAHPVERPDHGRRGEHRDPWPQPVLAPQRKPGRGRGPLHPLRAGPPGVLPPAQLFAEGLIRDFRALRPREPECAPIVKKPLIPLHGRLVSATALPVLASFLMPQAGCQRELPPRTHLEREMKLKTSKLRNARTLALL